MSEPQPISGKPIALGFHAVRGCVDTGVHRYCSRVFGAVEIRWIYESGMGPYLPRARRKFPPVMGLYPPRRALWSSNQSAISQRDCGFLTVRGGVDPRKLGFVPRLVEVLQRFGTTSGPGMGPYPPEVELAQHTNPIQSKMGRWGWVFTPCEEVSTERISVFVAGISELHMCGWIPMPGCAPIVLG